MTSFLMPRFVAAALLALAMPSASYAASDDTGNEASQHALSRVVGAPGEADAAARTVVIEMHDNYFEPAEIPVVPGEIVRLVVNNRGSFVHEFNLGTVAMHERHQDDMQMMVDHGVIEVDRINHDRMAMDMGGGHSMAHDHANSVLLEPGQSAEIVWTFSGSGALQYACNIPGHYDSGMYGEIVGAPDNRLD